MLHIIVFASKTYDRQCNTNDALLCLKGKTTDRICGQIPGAGFLMGSSAQGDSQRASFYPSSENEGIHIQCFCSGMSMKSQYPRFYWGLDQRHSHNRPAFFTPTNKAGG